VYVHFHNSRRRAPSRALRLMCQRRYSAPERGGRAPATAVFQLYPCFQAQEALSAPFALPTRVVTGPASKAAPLMQKHA